jgi:hypothetical protein
MSESEIAPARSLEQRKRDMLHLLEGEVDAWVATADRVGVPHLIPLSFLWDGSTLLLATFRSSPTARNLQAAGTVRLGIGATRDLVLIEGVTEALETTAISPETGDAFAAKTGFDPRRSASPFLYFRVTPRRIQAWREENELKDREIMRDGVWLDS